MQRNAHGRGSSSARSCFYWWSCCFQILLYILALETIWKLITCTAFVVFFYLLGKLVASRHGLTHSIFQQQQICSAMWGFVFFIWRFRMSFPISYLLWYTYYSASGVSQSNVLFDPNLCHRRLWSSPRIPSNIVRFYLSGSGMLCGWSFSSHVICSDLSKCCYRVQIQNCYSESAP